MKKNISLFVLSFFSLISVSFKSSEDNNIVSDKCEIVNFFEGIAPESGVKVLTSDGETEDAELILVPTRIDEGTYKIEISRKGSNIYKLEGTVYYVETRYCYEYATYGDAILKVESNYGYTKGTVYFD